MSKLIHYKRHILAGFAGFLFLLSNLLFADSVKFILSKKTVLRGEPLYATFEVEGGSSDIKLSKHIFSERGIIAEYIGSEQNLTAINNKVSQKRVLKFRIIASKSGKFKVPRIEVMINGKLYASDDSEFEVKPEKYISKKQPSSFQNPFNGNLNNPYNRTIIHPDEDDILILFDVTRYKVYVGEPIIGFFTVLYKKMNRPIIDRNLQTNIDFPFFTVDSMRNAKIELPPNTVYNGQYFDIFPYSKESFVLTPIKKGTYSVGEATFEVEGSVDSYFPPRNIMSKKKKVLILDLPTPKPTNFSGEVGDYEIHAKLDNNSIVQGQSINLIIKIKGEGYGCMIKNPLQNICPNKNCSADITLVSDNCNRVVSKLKNGGYGFISENEIRYTLYPHKEGNFQLDKFSITYFNPEKSAYLTKETSIPEFTVAKSTNNGSNIVHLPENRPFRNYIGYLVLALFVLSVSGLLFFYKMRIISFLDFLSAELLKPTKDKLEDIRYLDQIIGNKKNALLKNYLLQKGFNDTLIMELMSLKSSFPDSTILEIYKNSSNYQKQRILALVRSIIQEEKNEYRKR